MTNDFIQLQLSIWYQLVSPTTSGCTGFGNHRTTATVESGLDRPKQGSTKHHEGLLVCWKDRRCCPASSSGSARLQRKITTDKSSPARKLFDFDPSLKEPQIILHQNNVTPVQILPTGQHLRKQFLYDASDCSAAVATEGHPVVQYWAKPEGSHTIIDVRLIFWLFSGVQGSAACSYEADQKHCVHCPCL